MNKTIADTIIDRLQTLSPVHLNLVNESANHAGFYEGKESHFKLTLVSDAFVGKRLIARHQMVYQALDGLLTNQIVNNSGSNADKHASSSQRLHALAMHTYTTDEWHNTESAPDSPKCASQR